MTPEERAQTADTHLQEFMFLRLVGERLAKKWLQRLPSAHRVTQHDFMIAKETIMLKVGESSLEMKKDGTINLTGKTITISGKEKVTSGVGSQLVELDTAGVKVGGTKIDVAATGIAAISGALVKINC